MRLLIMPDKLLVTILIPVHNEEVNIPYLLDRISKTVDELPAFKFEVLFVDDGSTDNTVNVIEQHISGNTAIGYLKLSRNFGHQAALEAGLQYATGDAVISMDGDLQHPPEIIPLMLEHFSMGAEVVQMQRKNTGSDYKGILSVSFYTFFRWISSVPLVPNAADFRLLTRKVVLEINKNPGKGKLLRVLIPSLGYRQVYLPYMQDDRKFGKPKYTLSDSYELAMHTIFKFSGFPANSLLFGGIVSLIIGIVVFILIAFNILHSGNMMIGLALFASLAGLLLFGCGVICRYLYFILEQVRSDPSYIVSKIVSPRHEQVID